MKPFILFALLLINTISFSQNFWSKVEGLYGATGSSFAKDSSGIIYFANADLFKSSNSGISWAKINSPTPSTYTVSCNRNIFFVSANEGVFRSSNFGISWDSCLSSSYSSINQFAYNSLGHIFACSNSSGIYRSTDVGNSWIHFLDGKDIRSIFVDSVDNIYCGVLLGGLYKSTNNGNTWKKLGFNNTSIYSIVINSVNTIFVCAEGTIYKSTNDGSSWILANNGIYAAQGTNLFIKQNDVLFASNVFGVYKSTNNGINWLSISNELGEQSIYEFIEISNGSILVGGDGKGIYKTTNDGLNWTINNIGVDNTHIQSLYSFNNNLIAVMYHSGIYYSSNNGLSWNQTNVNTGGHYTEYSCIAKDNFGKLYCSIESSLYSSIDSGKIWTFISAPSVAILNIAFSTDNNIFVGHVGGGIRRSTNGGYNWIGLNIGHTSVLATNNNGDMYSIYFRTLYRSTNNGINWNTLPQLPSNDNYCMAFDGNNNIYLGTLTGIQFSSNNGQTWIQKLNLINPFKIVINGNNIYTIQDWGQKFYYSTNLGSNWNQINTGLENVYTVALTRSMGGELFCGTVHRGIFRANESIIPVSQISNNVPKDFRFFNNYPNPFNPVTNFRFEIPLESFITIKIFDMTGKEIYLLTDQYYKPGYYEISWDGSDFASGIYLVKFFTDNYFDTKKIVLLK
ncbi:MAG: T9SS type A sorting domain-containing protein [Ignavibacteria bacterium]|nr:T9SS type A sorting domain-containing protein [Ignavibacteria bacterium]